MKICRAVIMSIAVLLLTAYAISADFGYMRISLIEGDVQIKVQETEDWGLASINGPVKEGDQIWVPEGGRLELQLNTGTYIRLDQDSAVEILSIDESSSQFYFSQGHAYVYYNAPAESMIQVDTPDASTRAFDRAVFRIDIPNEYTDVGVYKGYVETENRIGKTRVNAGEILSIGQNTNGEIAPMGPPDEWEEWNKDRNDRVLERRGVSYGYLPLELREYSYDFNSYGRWVDVPQYGHCWTPTVVAGVDWAPYKQGRWIWRGGDYVWLAYEPWGWAPYHYGRWAFARGIGWCWIPPVAGAVYWGPGYVGWVRTADYVAWVPLAPGEIYYGRGYYGPNSVNIVNVNINRVRITNVYKNVYVNNGVTVVSRNTFATASPKVLRINENIIRQKIFVKNNISVGTPAIKPAKSSYSMSAKRVPSSKLPPKHITTLRVKELRKSRPLMRERNQSVLNPGVKPGQLPLKTVTTPKKRGKGRPMIQPVRPSESGKPGVQEQRPVPREEKGITIPKEQFAPEGGTAARGKRRITPPEERTVVPESRPATGKERHVMPTKNIPASEERPVPKEKKGKTQFENKFAPQSGPLQKEKKLATPPEEKPVVPENHPERRGKQHIKPVEKPAPQGQQVTKEEKKREGSKKGDKEKVEEPERSR